MSALAPAAMPLLESMFARAASRIAPARPGHDPWTDERRPEQTPPPGDWRTWLVMAGRGFGKTRTGAEWIREEIMAGRMRRVALVGPTAADVREVMVEGPAGMIAVCDRIGFRPLYEPSRRQLTFPNGAVIKTYSAEEPNRLRGPEHDGAWCDEIATWSDQQSWDNLQFGLRVGANPRQIATTTPRPVKFVRDLLTLQESGVVALTRGSTYDNRANLAPAFFDQIVRKYEGTRLGRQELLAELLTDTPGALWKLEQIDDHRVPKAPSFLQRIVIGVDPDIGGEEETSETGIIVAALGEDGDGYVLADSSIHASPAGWSRAVVAAYDAWQADAIIAEANQGGKMVAHTLETVRSPLPITLVHASRGKLTRAEPVAALAEQGRIHHVGALPHLEDQLTTYDGSGDSPDRLDAYVWAMTALMIGLGGPSEAELAAGFRDMPGI